MPRIVRSKILSVATTRPAHDNVGLDAIFIVRLVMLVQDVVVCTASFLVSLTSYKKATVPAWSRSSVSDVLASTRTQSETGAASRARIWTAYAARQLPVRVSRFA